MARRKADPAELEARLGHAFRDPDLLTRALTHVSGARGGESYQRLEFLGDRVLGLAVAEMLVRAFPRATEGELSQRLSDLVRREACAVMAESWDVGPHLILGTGEVQSGGRRNRAILADAAESILGAVFMDAGYEPARALVERALAEQVTAPRTPPRDPKTALQEWAQGLGRPTPVYVIVERSGPDHAPHFHVAARVNGTEQAIGTGGSKRAAEQDAAQRILLREGVWQEQGEAANV
ncbi:MAG TPA: ribonuclease III [Enterovirga sp.]|jgi:ribonuclease-3|nr:ribonuclease III [Enterovirga sp.]